MFPTYWIAYIDLRKYSNNFSAENPFEFLKQFFNLKNDFEKQIFSSSYKSGKIILLWDGFDEIPEKYREYVVNSISFIHQNTAIIQVVSAQLSFENLKKEDQDTIKRALVRYKNNLIKLSELFPDNTEVFKAINPIHASKILNNEILNLSDPEFSYLVQFINHRWSNLHKSLKDKVLNSKLNFQNRKIEFKVVDQLYPEILTFLTSEQISSILDGKTLEIGKMIENPINSGHLNEKVKSLKDINPDEQICSNNSFWNHSDKFDFLNDNYGLVRNENLGELIKVEEPPNRQFFILTLETTLEVIKGFDQNSIKNIKEKYPYHWIVYINSSTFNDYARVHQRSIFIFPMLQKIFTSSLENEFEKKFITSAYNSGRVIFFWDGFSLENNYLLIEIIRIIYNSSQNIQFISSQVSCDRVNRENITEVVNEEPEQNSNYFLSWLIELIVNIIKSIIGFFNF
jgi:hypothetical protein